MTDSAASATEEPLFTAVEIEQFEADDVVAGAAIGKMLSALFFYTVLVMTFVGWWTYTSIHTDHGNAEQTEQVEH